MHNILQNSYLEVRLWEIIRKYASSTQPGAGGVFIFPFVIVAVSQFAFEFSVAAPWVPHGSPHLGCGEWAPSWPVWFRVSHSLTPSQSTIGLRQKGKRCHVHLPCFFTEQANLNIAYDHNLSRIKIAQNKWQMAGKGALCQEMAEGLGGWGGGDMGFWDGSYRLE